MKRLVAFLVIAGSAFGQCKPGVDPILTAVLAPFTGGAPILQSCAKVTAGSGGATIANTANLISGDGAGNGVDSGIAPASVVLTTNNLVDLSSITTARTNLGLGSSATHPATDFATSTGLGNCNISKYSTTGPTWSCYTPVSSDMVMATNTQTGTGAYTIDIASAGKSIIRNQAAHVADTLAQAGTGGIVNGFTFEYSCLGAGGCGITPATSTIDGATQFSLTTGQSVRITTDGTNYFTSKGVSGYATVHTLEEYGVVGCTAPCTPADEHVAIQAATDAQLAGNTIQLVGGKKYGMGTTPWVIGINGLTIAGRNMLNGGTISFSGATGDIVQGRGADSGCGATQGLLWFKMHDLTVERTTPATATAARGVSFINTCWGELDHVQITDSGTGVYSSVRDKAGPVAPTVFSGSSIFKHVQVSFTTNAAFPRYGFENDSSLGSLYSNRSNQYLQDVCSGSPNGAQITCLYDHGAYVGDFIATGFEATAVDYGVVVDASTCSGVGCVDIDLTGLRIDGALIAGVRVHNLVQSGHAGLNINSGYIRVSAPNARAVDCDNCENVVVSGTRVECESSSNLGVEIRNGGPVNNHVTGGAYIGGCDTGIKVSTGSLNTFDHVTIAATPSHNVTAGIVIAAGGGNVVDGVTMAAAWGGTFGTGISITGGSKQFLGINFIDPSSVTTPVNDAVGNSTCVNQSKTWTTNTLMKGSGVLCGDGVVTGITVDSSNNMSTPGGYTSGAGGSVAGYFDWGQGTATSVAANSVGFMSPVTVTTPYRMTFAPAPVTGFVLSTGTTSPTALSFVAGTGSGNVVRDTSSTIVSTTVNSSLTVTGVVDNSGASRTAPMKVGTSLPGTCTTGDTYFKSDATAGQQIYECSATNVWTQQLNSGAGGSGGGTSGWSANPLTFATTATQYAPPVGGGATSATETTVSIAFAAAATIAHLHVSLSAQLGASATLAVTLQDGTANPSALTCVTTSGGTTCTDDTHSVNVAQGDLVSFKLVSSGTVTAGIPMIVIQYTVGTVGVGTTSFSTGSLSPLFTASVATSTTTPALSFTLSNFAAHTFYGNNTGSTAAPGAQTIGLSDLPATLTQTIASGAKALATSAIASAACSSAQTATATGTLTTDAIEVSFNADPTAVTGYVPLTTGMLTIIPYPTADTVNFKVCNNTSASITPGAITLNWRVTR